MKNKYNLAARAALFVLGLTAAFALNTTAIAQAPPGSLWYNGDFDSRNGGANQDNGQLGNGFYSHIYDNFTGPSSGTWTVTGLFSDNLLAPALPGAITSASWDIRTGVSVGNGGTVVASGTTAATVTATGRSGFNLLEYQVMVSGLSISLPALGSGFYWLNVSPIVPIGVVGQSFQSTTSGANAVGTPPGNDGNSFWNSNLFMMNFASTTALFGSGTWDVSEGVIGTVPEPATWALLTCGVGALLIAARRRRGA
jgi:hypothetical protein